MIAGRATAITPTGLASPVPEGANVALSPERAMVKGFEDAVRLYEVRWQS